MPSLADIPEQYLDLNHREDFIAWLNMIPIPPADKKELLHLWGKALDTSISKEEYARVLPPDW